MPDICLLGDVCTGHGAFPPRANAAADSYLTVNGRPVHCVGHAWSAHCNPDPSCHGGALAGGSSYYTVNGAAVGRIGDPVDCGSAVASGDPYFNIKD